MLLTPSRLPIAQRQGRNEMKIRSAGIDRGFLKSPWYDRFRMPQSSGRDMATVELAQVAGASVFYHQAGANCSGRLPSQDLGSAKRNNNTVLKNLCGRRINAKTSPEGHWKPIPKKKAFL
jgi:hypothetical protein